ncbi:MAG: 50S ribosomal protein L9 [Candidatus Vogelbacteria bacterium CG10_big_fil_rev_8_21_14_0_10_49_38]|uniref:Large ribosomal subunit protein bL9 n=1 Tax=Candidatus Vogelbacteria bacterium CG10_big_fil_rev_8_21_14_0_10_49_38 TaxID=1975043 RepID=A0A2H0RHB7_9BACT|nr:MAG: 50S ribosomal protein L9 [bacterium CG10_49_38]PIR45830.1 MAG: 50S ribosomal protein L9 [Candidatus Vogelbacteria bacterium CG10_big_fil_rev_8_21_14_0_10_49_38]
MKVILIQDVAKVGRKGEVKEVNDGFARNFLLTQGRAVAATAVNLAHLGETKKVAAQNESWRSDALGRLVELSKTDPLTLKAKANPSGQLFAGLHESDVVAAVKAQFGLNLDPKLIRLDQPIKQTGTHQLVLKLASAKKKLPLKVEAL